MMQIQIRLHIQDKTWDMNNRFTIVAPISLYLFSFVTNNQDILSFQIQLVIITPLNRKGT